MGKGRRRSRGEGESSVDIIQMGSFCSVPNYGWRKSRVPKNGLISIPHIDHRTKKKRAKSADIPELMNLETESIKDAFGAEKLAGQSGQLA